MNLSECFENVYKIYQFEFFCCGPIPPYGKVPEVPNFGKFLKNYFESQIRSTKTLMWHNIKDFAQCFHRLLLKGLCSVNWPNFIVWLPLLLVILGNTRIAIACYSGFDVINFEINLIFPIKSFFYMTKKSRQKIKYHENKESFSGETKSIFHHFERVFTCQKQVWDLRDLKSERAPLSVLNR